MKTEYPQLSLYDHHLDEIRRMRAHILSPVEEKLMALAGNVTRGPSQIFRMIDDADIKYGEIVDEEGEKVALTKQRYYDLLESKDRRVRKETMETFTNAYKTYVNTLGATLVTLIYKDLHESRGRKYPTCLGRRWMPTIFRRRLTEIWLRPWTTIWGCCTVTPFAQTDSGRGRAARVRCLRAAGAGRDMKITYDEATTLSAKDFNPWAKSMSKTCSRKSNRVGLTSRKRGQRIGRLLLESTYAAHPYVLMNYNDTLNNCSRCPTRWDTRCTPTIRKLANPTSTPDIRSSPPRCLDDERRTADALHAGTRQNKDERAYPCLTTISSKLWGVFYSGHARNLKPRLTPRSSRATRCRRKSCAR